MAITLVGSVQANEFANSRSPVISIDSGKQADDILVYVIVTSTSVGHPTTFPSGHNQIGGDKATGNDHGMVMGWHKVTGSTGSSITLTDLLDANDWGHTACAVLRGVDTTAPINVYADTGSTTGTSVAGPSITPTSDDCYIIQSLGTDPSGTITGSADSTPSATELYDGKDSLSTGYIYMQGYLQGTAAAIALDATMDTSINFLHFQIALEPAAGGGGVTIPLMYHHYRTMKAA